MYIIVIQYFKICIIIRLTIISICVTLILIIPYKQWTYRVVFYIAQLINQSFCALMETWVRNRRNVCKTIILAPWKILFFIFYFHFFLRELNDDFSLAWGIIMVVEMKSRFMFYWLITEPSSYFQERIFVFSYFRRQKELLRCESLSVTLSFVLVYWPWSWILESLKESQLLLFFIVLCKVF